MRSLRLPAIILLAEMLVPLSSVSAADVITVLHAPDASKPESLAARELRRYLYLRTGVLPSLAAAEKAAPAGQALLVGSKDRKLITELASTTNLASEVARLAPQQYMVRSVERDGRRTVLIAGGDPVGSLYGAYRFIECLGVRFYMHGDVVPDEPMPAELPSVNIVGKPLFPLRGLQPFHDFPEGPDWWNLDEYKSVMSQMVKMGMNFFGLHTYPEGGVGPEPVVWIGMAEDVADDGSVRFSYPSRHFTTTSGTWGYAAKKTGDYNWGAATLFEADDHAPDYLKGRTPWPATPQDRNAVFNECAAMLRDAFTYARSLGIKTCVGTETPLTIPTPLKEKLQAAGKNPGDLAVIQKLYEGMFTRIAKAYPIDYYWLWTPEGWTWSGVKDTELKATLDDLKAARDAIRESKAPFTLATCGWVLGPPQDRALFDNMLPKEMPMSCINRAVGKEPVEPGFAKVKGRPTWAIPWLEDDPALAAPQLWAGRMRRDAFDALRYGCSGLMGIHWRTRNLGPNVSALAKAAWDQKGWGDGALELLDPPCREGTIGGQIVTYANNPIADTEDDPLYQSVRYNLSAYRIAVPNGTYTVTLKFCEVAYAEKDKRVFGVSIQGKRVIDRLDIFEKVGQNRVLDYTFKDVAVTDGQLVIDFAYQVELPCIAAIVVEGSAATRRINCGGPAYKDYEADLPTCPTAPRNLPIGDFYADWARAHFGPDAAPAIAKIFERIDGHLPEPIIWTEGPGGIRPDGRPWEQVAKEYGFVDELAALRPQIRGAGNLERFDYWLNGFLYLRTVAQFNCVWAIFNGAMKQAEDAATPDARRELARSSVLPIRREMIRLAGEVYRLLLSHVSTSGELGTVANWEQHNLAKPLLQRSEQLAALLGEPLPADAMPSKVYSGQPRLFVPVARTSLCEGEPLRLKAIVLSQTQPQEVVVFHRPLGTGEFARLPMKHVGRGVYAAELTVSALKDGAVEYYVQAGSGDTALRWPPTAPNLNHSVVEVPK